MTSCTIHIKDEVNIKISDLVTATRRKLEKEFKYFQPWAYHSPAYKLGRWDGCVSYFSLGGSTYFNLLDRILPILVDEGYNIEIDDQRTNHSFQFVEVTEKIFTDYSMKLGVTAQFSNGETIYHKVA